MAASSRRSSDTAENGRSHASITSSITLKGPSYPPDSTPSPSPSKQEKTIPPAIWYRFPKAGQVLPEQSQRPHQVRNAGLHSRLQLQVETDQMSPRDNNSLDSADKKRPPNDGSTCHLVLLHRPRNHQDLVLFLKKCIHARRGRPDVLQSGQHLRKIRGNVRGCQPHQRDHVHCCRWLQEGLQ